MGWKSDCRMSGQGGRGHVAMSPNDAPSLSPELALAAACAMWPPSDKKAAAMAAAVARGVDWPCFVKVVRRNRGGGFAHNGLKAAQIDLPQAVERELSQLAREILHREMFCAAEVIRLKGKLDQAEIPVRVLK